MPETISVHTPLGTLEGTWEEDDTFTCHGPVTYQATSYYFFCRLYWKDGSVQLVKAGPKPGQIFDCQWRITTRTGRDASINRRSDMWHYLRPAVDHAMKESKTPVQAMPLPDAAVQQLTMF